MEKKLVVSDYDRTLYLNDSDIKINTEIIKKFRANNNFFIVATGRSLYHFNIMKEKYNINYDFLILNHGAEIRDNKNNLIYYETIDNDIKNQLINKIDIENTIDNLNFTLDKSFTNINDKNLIKINLKYKTYENAIKIRDNLNKEYKDYINCYYVNNNAIEIISNKTNKSYAINILKDKLNIEDKNIYVIGDGYSDFEMIKDFNGYCMENSIDCIKEIAKKEYSSVSELIKDIINEKV